MAFDWLATLTNYQVPFSTSGKNVSKGNFVVHCPFCGHEDQGQHMSVALKGRGWRCFRRPEHKGQHPARLLAALLHCSLDQAIRLVGDAVYVPEDFMGAINAALSTAAPARAKPLKMPSIFKTFEPGSHARPSARPYIRYLIGKRGFSAKQVNGLTARYGLRYCTSGPYAGRIIFPVRKGPDLCSWTGRAIGHSTLRYKSLSPDPEKAESEGLPPAMGPISDYLLFHNLIKKSDADTLYLCEGPFDALKVSVLGQSRGAIATCCFTASPSASQVNELHGLFPKFKRRILLLDNGTLPTTLRVASLFAGMGLEIGQLPNKVKDPGDLTQAQFDGLHGE
jgi:hypothetical protein